MYETSGARFGLAFDPAAVQRSAWGPLTLAFDGYDPALTTQGRYRYAGPANWGSGELALITPDSISALEGFGHITARHTSGEASFLSGVMTTRGTFSQMYGRYEVRVRIPEGRGLEAYFELLPVSLKMQPAIDVFRVLGAEPGVDCWAISLVSWSAFRKPRKAASLTFWLLSAAPTLVAFATHLAT